MPDGSPSGRDCLDHHPLGIGGSLFTVYRATLLLMDAAPPEMLGNSRLVVYIADLWMRSRAVAPENRAGSRSRRVRRQHFELRLGKAEGGSVRVGRLRQHVVQRELFRARRPRPHSRTPQLLKMESAASPNCHRGKGPGVAHAAHASTHGSPRNPLDRSIPAKKEYSATSSTALQVAREVLPSALTSMHEVQGIGPWCADLLFYWLPCPAAPTSTEWNAAEMWAEGQVRGRATDSGSPSVPAHAHRPCLCFWVSAANRRPRRFLTDVAGGVRHFGSH